MSTHCTGFLTAERSIAFIAAAVAQRPDFGFKVVLRAAAGCVRPAARPPPPCLLNVEALGCASCLLLCRY